jgi:hypothetical protein
VKLQITNLLSSSSDNPCLAKKNTNNFVIGNFTILNSFVSQSCVKIVKLQIKKIISIKKKGQNTTKKSQSCLKL